MSSTQFSSLQGANSNREMREHSQAAFIQPVSSTALRKSDDSKKERKLIGGHLDYVKRLGEGGKSARVVFSGIDPKIDDEAADKFLRQRVYWAFTLAQRKYIEETNVESKKAAIERSKKSRRPEQYEILYETFNNKKIARDGTPETPYRYYLAPVFDLSILAESIKFGKVTSSGGGTIHVHYELNAPLPTIAFASNLERYGAENIAHLHITSADGDKEIVKQFLELHVEPLGQVGDSLKIFETKEPNQGEFDLWVAPVSDLDALAKKNSWGDVTEVNQGKDRGLVITARLPDPLPTQSDLDLIVAADEAGKPRPGEDKLQWSIQTVSHGKWPAMGNAIRYLQSEPAQEEFRKSVASALLGALYRDYTDSRSMYADNFLMHVRAMMNWSTDETESLILQFFRDQDRYTSATLEILARLNSKESISELANQLASQQNRYRAEKLLVTLGAPAEEPVLGFLRAPDPKVRLVVYNILTEIGSESSLALLTENAKNEKDPAMRSAARSVIAAIRLRAKAAKAKAE